MFSQEGMVKIFSITRSCNCNITFEGPALCSCWPHDHQLYHLGASLTPGGIAESDWKSHQITLTQSCYFFLFIFPPCFVFL